MAGTPIRAAILALVALFFPVPGPAVRAGEPEVAVPAHPPGATAATARAIRRGLAFLRREQRYNHLPILSR